MKNVLKCGMLIVFSLVVILSTGITASADYTYTEDEGDALYSKFLTATAVLDNGNYTKGLAILGTSTNNVDWIVDNGYFTEEEWKSLSSYERMCYYRLYFFFCIRAESGDYSSYYDSIDDVNFYFLSDIGTLNKTQQFPDGVYQAFEEIIHWQYNYFLANGDIYNFVTGDTYLAHKSNTDVKTEEDVVVPNVNGTENSITEEVATESPTAQNQLPQKLLRNAYLIVAFVILAIGWILFVYKRKKENREDTMNEK